MKINIIISQKDTSIGIEDIIRTLNIISIDQIIKKVTQEIPDKKIIKSRA